MSDSEKPLIEVRTDSIQRGNMLWALHPLHISPNINPIGLIHALDAADEGDDIIQFVSGMYLEIHVTLHNAVYRFGVQAID